ncbi:MAG TPA: ABC transporter permease [Chloroflexota bacterium]|nr:ABC transporter permease [Chloroflexota bacterium]
MLFFEALRNISRRRVRSGLTIFGIVIGAFATTVMGGLSESFNRQVEGAVRLAGSTIEVEPKAPRRELAAATLARLQRVEGVHAAFGRLIDPLEAGGGFGPPLQVAGMPPELVPETLPGVRLAAGRWLQRGDRYQAIVGANVAATKKLRLGDGIEWRRKRYTVVGALERTETSPDWMVIVPFDVVRREMRLPADATGNVSVVPVPGADPEEVAREINARVPSVTAHSPRRRTDEMRQGMVVFTAVTLGSALVSGLVGGLSVVNTMVMAVRERQREIGLKKAVGAPDGAIVAEYLAEAAAIGLIGGLAGILLGAAVAQLLNAAFRGGLAGASLFAVTPRLTAAVLGFAVGLGSVAGLYPAWSAARLDPVEALRAE